MPVFALHNTPCRPKKTVLKKNIYSNSIVIHSIKYKILKAFEYHIYSNIVLKSYLTFSECMDKGNGTLLHIVKCVGGCSHRFYAV